MAESIPLIDLTGDEQLTISLIRSACEEVGFFQVTGHGVDLDVLDRAWRAARAFFDLPIADRMAAARRHGDDAYGYIPIEVESLNRSMNDDVAPADLKETFNIGPDRRPVRAISDAGEQWAFADSPWPPALPELRPALTAYFDALLELSSRLMRLFALALDLPGDFFDAMIDESPSALRVLNYPHQDRAPAPGQLRAGAHTDYGTLTLLRQDDAPGGLEVLDPRTGAWTPAPYTPEALVVNLGDLMARWTNDRWRSTLHRVVNPPTTSSDPSGSTRRQSMALFHNANFHAVVECLPTCLAPGETPRYGPVEAGPHLMAKFQRTVTPTP